MASIPADRKLFLGDDKPERMHHSWQPPQEGQQDVDPEVQRQSDLHEGCNWRKENSQKDFDNVHVTTP